MGNVALGLLLLWCGIYTCSTVRKARQLQICSRDKWLPGLSLLYYECTDIDFAAPITFGTWSAYVGSISKIRCVNCKISSPTSFVAYGKLSSLEIVDSYLPNVTLGLFNDLERLKYLTLSSSNISFVEYHAFRRLEKLQSLNLSFNSINDIRLADLSIFSNITTFDFSFNAIKDATFPKTIQTLNLTHNELIIKDGTFSGLQSLLYLDLSYNKFKSILEHAFQDLISLLVLNLSGNNFVSFDYACFSGLNKLASLNVSFNSISDLPEYVFHDVPNIQQLYLNNNNLSEFNLKLVHENLKHLSIIFIHDNFWNCNALSNVIRTLKKGGIEIRPGKCMKPPNIINICCTKDAKEVQQNFTDHLITVNSALQTLNKFFTGNSNVTLENKIIDRIDALKSTFGELFQTLNKSNHNYPYKDILLGAMATALGLLGLMLVYVVYRNCRPKGSKCKELKLYPMFKPKITTTTVSEPDVDIA